MRIDTELALFLTSPVTIVVGTSDDTGRPDIGRAVGARVAADTGVIELVVSAWQWPVGAENLRANGRAAVTFARPTDYVCYQVKGRATLRAAEADDVALAERYMTDILAVLESLGLAPELAAPWLTSRGAIVVRLEAEHIFVQTPGAKAGRPLGDAA
jgi:hypothetical protein